MKMNRRLLTPHQTRLVVALLLAFVLAPVFAAVAGASESCQPWPALCALFSEGDFSWYVWLCFLPVC